MTGRGLCTASRHVADCLSAIERMDGQLKAMITVTAEGAYAAARAEDEARDAGRAVGPLAGMTVALKDVIRTAGVRTTNGSDIDRDMVPDEDAEVVRRLKDAGAIIVGKANLHEYAYGGTSQNPFHGACRNPWARRSPRTCAMFRSAPTPPDPAGCRRRFAALPR